MTKKIKQKEARQGTHLAVKPEKVEKAQDNERPVVAQPSAAELLGLDVGEVKIRRAKGSKNITQGVCHILATFNNTKITFTSNDGSVIASSSAGRHGFKGSRKSTAYAAQVIMQEAAKVAMSHGLKEIFVKVSGAGGGKDAAMRALIALALSVLGIQDVTPIPHGGCRPKKGRRV